MLSMASEVEGEAIRASGGPEVGEEGAGLAPPWACAGEGA